MFAVIGLDAGRCGWSQVPLALGSWWGLAVGAVMIAAAILRTALEDQTLQRELWGYDAYSRQVRYRLLPGVW